MLAALLEEFRREHEVRVLALRAADQEGDSQEQNHLRLVPRPQTAGLGDAAALVPAFVRRRPLRADAMAASLVGPLREELEEFDADVVHVTSPNHLHHPHVRAILAALAIACTLPAVAAKQDRLFGIETETDGYQLLRLFAAYSAQAGRAVHTITVRLDNVTDELYRNHLSLIKDLAPEMGRNFKVLYNVRF